MIRDQYRAALGVTLIVVSIVVAVLGWIGVSGETEVAFQLPYFASAGVASLLLLGSGAALLLGVQLERDRERLADIELAVRELADEIAHLAEDIKVVRKDGSGSRRKPVRAVKDAGSGSAA